MSSDIVLDIERFHKYAAEANGLVLLRDDASPKWVILIECDSTLQAVGLVLQ